MRDSRFPWSYFLVFFSAGVLQAGAPYTVTELPTLGGNESAVYAISNSIQITGYSYLAGDKAYHAFLYHNGVMTDLGTLGGATSVGWAVNDSGQVAGLAQTASGASHAFLYSGGVMKDLGTLGGTISNGYGINASGEVTGWSQTANDAAWHPFIYSNGVMKDIGTLGGRSQFLNSAQRPPEWRPRPLLRVATGQSAFL